jgi:DNA mismatch repair protein MutS
LFATHYFELTELAGEFPSIANVHLDAVELHDQKRGEQLVFMHAVKDGPANRSFGLQVAALAGLPKAVITEARETLAALERGEPAGSLSSQTTRLASPQTDLFASKPDPKLAALADALRELEPDSLAPREALDALYRLRALL